MADITKLNVDVSTVSEMLGLLGANDKHLKLLSELYSIELYQISGGIGTNTADETIVSELNRIFQILKSLHTYNIHFGERDIIYIKNMLKTATDEAIAAVFMNRREIIKTFAGKPIYAKTITQQKYLDSIENNTVVFAIGPAGTGKTYLAVLVAIKKLREGVVKQIILTRPAVEAGENLGFLPGDLKEKIDPYLRPLYDALHEILGSKQTEELIFKNIIEIAPLAYMRGRTLENAFVILDEAQNTTVGQMKLFLTRLGFNSKMVVTGDVTQTDLPKKIESGLVKAAEILQSIRGIDIIQFEAIDVVRHPLVQSIIKRFEDAEN